ncbi:MAG: hypothetical protein IVW36_12315 [Dehalococcoidia bacterium]|nr:hypothetical protein [Dehalococcoidia bacterium]
MTTAKKPATGIFAEADRLGRHLERRLDEIEAWVSARPFGSPLLGIGTALAVIAGGLAAFVAALVVVVQLSS